MNTTKYAPDSVGEFMADIADIQDKWEQMTLAVHTPWFRGHTDSHWSLVPSIYRPPHHELNEHQLRYDFHRRAHPFLTETTYQPDTEFDWYFLMQHYGLPTRLLDWTESALIALFFATRKANRPGNRAVWVLNPWKLNELVADIGDVIPSPKDAAIQSYLTPVWSYLDLPKYPLALKPPYNSKRLASQRGAFTIHGLRKRGLEGYAELQPHLVRIIIPQSSVATIRRELTTAGMVESVIFPDLSGLCREIYDEWIESDRPLKTSDQTDLDAPTFIRKKAD